MIFTLCVLLTGCGPKNDPAQYRTEKVGGNIGTCSTLNYTNNIMIYYTKYPVTKVCSSIDSVFGGFSGDLSHCEFYYKAKTLLLSFHGIISNTNYYTVLPTNRIVHIYLSNAQYRTNILKEFPTNDTVVVISANSKFMNMYRFILNPISYLYPIYSLSNWSIIQTNKYSKYPITNRIYDNSTNDRYAQFLVFSDAGGNYIRFFSASSTNTISNVNGALGFSKKNRYFFYTVIHYRDVSADAQTDESIDKWHGTAYIYDCLLKTNYCLVDYTARDNAVNGIGAWTTSVTNHWIDEYCYSNNIIYKTNWRSNVIINTVRTSNFIYCDYWKYEDRMITNNYLFVTKDVPIGFSEDLKYFYFIILGNPKSGYVLPDGKILSNELGLYRMDISSLNLTE